MPTPKRPLFLDPPKPPLIEMRLTYEQAMRMLALLNDPDNHDLRRSLSTKVGRWVRRYGPDALSARQQRDFDAAFADMLQGLDDEDES